ncbi:MAG: alpha/beta hydrolase [Terriglobia bacterium]
MHNKVVFRAAKAAILEGLPTLRFNFRGVGQSAGGFGGGVGEREDVRAALDFLAARFPGSSICLMGFSFGSWVGLSVGATDPRVATLVGLGVPVGSVGMESLLEVTKPKLIVQGTLDQYGPKPKLQALFDRLKEPKRLHWVEGVDHFFNGKLPEVEKCVRGFLRETLVASG